MTGGAVDHRRSGDEITGVEVPQWLSRSRIEGRKRSLVLACEYEAACCRNQARTVMIRGDLLVVPHSLSGESVERPHIKLPLLLHRRTLDVSCAAPHSSAR